MLNGKKLIGFLCKARSPSCCKHQPWYMYCVGGGGGGGQVWIPSKTLLFIDSIYNNMFCLYMLHLILPELATAFYEVSHPMWPLPVDCGCQ